MLFDFSFCLGLVVDREGRLRKCFRINFLTQFLARIASTQTKSLKYYRKTFLLHSKTFFLRTVKTILPNLLNPSRVDGIVYQAELAKLFLESISDY